MIIYFIRDNSKGYGVKMQTTTQSCVCLSQTFASFFLFLIFISLPVQAEPSNKSGRKTEESEKDPNDDSFAKG